MTALSGALMPGPLLTVTIARAATEGFIAPLLLMVGHSLLELLVVVWLIFGLGRLLKARPVIGTISVLGGAVLLWMGWGMIPSALNGALDLHASGSASPVSGAGPLRNLVVTGMAVSISNPYWVIWWATVGAALFATLARKPGGSRTSSVGAFYIGHIMGDVVWYLLVGAAVVTGRVFISPGAYRVIVVVCGAFLMFLGASFLYLIASGKLWAIQARCETADSQCPMG